MNGTVAFILKRNSGGKLANWLSREARRLGGPQSRGEECLKSPPRCVFPPAQRNFEASWAPQGLLSGRGSTRSLALECPAQGIAADLQNPRHSNHCLFAAGDHPAGMIHISRAQLVPAPELHPAPLCGRKASSGPLFGEIPLDLTQPPEDRQEQFARRARQVDRFGQRPKCRATIRVRKRDNQDENPVWGEWRRA